MSNLDITTELTELTEDDREILALYKYGEIDDNDRLAAFVDAASKAKVSTKRMLDIFRDVFDGDIDSALTSDTVTAVIDGIVNGDSDIYTDDMRLISSAIIDEILVGELSDDTYLLGCFNSRCIAKATELPEKVILLLQEAEEYESLGEVILSTNGAVERLAAMLVKLDGYGHHFGRYDGETHRLGVYYVFRN